MRASIDSFSSRHAWVPFLLLSLGFAIMVATLGGCYALASSEGHLYPGLPSISALGNQYPEHILFAVGFALISVCVGGAILFRLAQVPVHAALNVVLLVLAVIACVFLIVMGAIPDSVSYWHFVGAGVGMGGFSVVLIVHSVHALVLSGRRPRVLDERLSLAFSRLLYAFSLLCAILAISLFGYWMAGNQDRTAFEWAGVALVLVAFTPWMIFFLARRVRKAATYETL